MGKVTSKLQVTVPKAIADHYGIRPGDDIAWQAAGAAIQVMPPGRRSPALSVDARLKLYDAATARQRQRQKGRKQTGIRAGRGWRREDLYARGLPR